LLIDFSYHVSIHVYTFSSHPASHSALSSTTPAPWTSSFPLVKPSYQYNIHVDTLYAPPASHSALSSTTATSPTTPATPSSSHFPESQPESSKNPAYSSPSTEDFQLLLVIKNFIIILEL